MTPFQVDIVNAIREALDQLKFSYDNNTHKVWRPGQDEPLCGLTSYTETILTALGEAAQAVFHQGVSYEVWSAYHGGEYNRWDMTWLERDKQGLIVDVPLVAECELNVYGNSACGGGLAEIVKDFDKLLTADAAVRLMIHGHWAPREKVCDVPAMHQHLRRRIENFRRTRDADVYMHIALEQKPGADHYTKHYYTLWPHLAEVVAPGGACSG